MADIPLFLGVIPGGVDIKGAGEKPADILFPPVSLARPSGGIYTITAANVAQTLAAARVERKGWCLQNFDGDELWWEYDDNPVPYQSFKVEPYAFWICPPSLLATGIIKILCARATARFNFREAY